MEQEGQTMPVSKGRLVSRVALLFAATMLATMGIAAPAHAVVGNFCSSVGLNAYGSAGNTDRCAASYHSAVRAVWASNTSTSVMKCAVLKPNSDGSGGNVGGIAADCQPGTTTAMQYHNPTRGGHATIINQGANYHTGFFGQVEWL